MMLAPSPCQGSVSADLGRLFPCIVIGFSPVLPIALTYYNPSISGSCTLGKDASLISRFKPPVKEVQFFTDFGPIVLEIYHGSCSKIGPLEQLTHKTRHLELVVAVLNNSQVSYSFVVSDYPASESNLTFAGSGSDSNLTSASCAARVVVYTDYHYYYRFFAFEHISESSSTRFPNAYLHHIL